MIDGICAGRIAWVELTALKTWSPSRSVPGT
jgi:hypothetical protein